MGIDIYVRWKGQNDDERHAQAEVWLDAQEGGVGYLREAYHGEPYATRFLCNEAFESSDGRAAIPAAVLRERLPETLRLAEQREHEVYNETDEKAIEAIQESFVSFVELCERKEKETGEPVEIIASY